MSKGYKTLKEIELDLVVKSGLIQQLKLKNKELQDKIERLNEILDVIHEEIQYLYRKPKRMWYDDIQTLRLINKIVEKELKGVDKE